MARVYNGRMLHVLYQEDDIDTREASVQMMTLRRAYSVTVSMGSKVKG